MDAYIEIRIRKVKQLHGFPKWIVEKISVNGCEERAYETVGEAIHEANRMLLVEKIRCS